MFTRIVICFAFLLGGLTLSSNAMAAPKKSAKKADAKVKAKPGKKGKKAKLKKIKAKVKLGDLKGKLAGKGGKVQADAAKSCPSNCGTSPKGGYCICCTGKNDCDSGCPAGTDKVEQGSGEFYCRTDPVDEVGGPAGGGAATTQSESGN